MVRASVCALFVACAPAPGSNPAGGDAAPPTADAADAGAGSSDAAADAVAADALTDASAPDGVAADALTDASAPDGVAADADVAPSDTGDTVEDDTAPAADAEVTDGDSTDAEPADAADADGGAADGPDASPDDVSPPEGFGVLGGACGDIDREELEASSGTTVRTTIDFGEDPFDEPEDVALLTDGGRAVLEAGNAGGSSLYSEVFAFEVLARCEGATLERTERTVLYREDYTGPITDLVVVIDGVRLGVSVTRAVGFPRDAPYTVERAAALLEDKLGDIVSSTSGVDPSEAWSKQILHVIAYAEGHVEALEEALATLDDATVADTIVLITESRGDDAFLY